MTENVRSLSEKIHGSLGGGGRGRTPIFPVDASREMPDSIPFGLVNSHSSERLSGCSDRSTPVRRSAAGWNSVLPGSSVAEQVTVNHLVAGSIPARAAIFHFVPRSDRR